MTQEEKDKKYIKQCIKLSREAVSDNRNPFASIIVSRGKVISEAKNGSKEEISHHAEMLVLREATKKLKTRDLSNCTLYSNFEPCPMCSFMIREHKVGRVVFALRSWLMGGLSKWNILQDEDLSKIKPAFSDPPEIKAGLYEKEAAKVFDEISWTIHLKKDK